MASLFFSCSISTVLRTLIFPSRNSPPSCYRSRRMSFRSMLGSKIASYSATRGLSRWTSSEVHLLLFLFIFHTPLVFFVFLFPLSIRALGLALHSSPFSSSRGISLNVVESVWGRKKSQKTSTCCSLFFSSCFSVFLLPPFIRSRRARGVRDLHPPRRNSPPPALCSVSSRPE